MALSKKLQDIFISACTDGAHLIKLYINYVGWVS